MSRLGPGRISGRTVETAGPRALPDSGEHGEYSVMTSVSQDLPILERDAGRIVVLDSEDRVLLFHTREMTAPELGEWWERPGGGIDQGETYREAAVRN